LPVGALVGQYSGARLIQEEGPRPADPLATFDEDYAQAVLHLAWDRHAGTNARTLLFAMVELLPVEVPPPLDDGEQRERLGGSSEHHVYVRRVVVPARRALAWYLDCRRGVAVLPDEEGRLPEAGETSAVKMVLADLGEEPPWPTLYCVSGSDESNTVPFCPAWHQRPRVHHLVPLAEMRREELWPKEAERTRATAFLAERLHFNLEEYPEYWGAVHLVAPNPVYRALEMRVQAGPPPRSSLLVRFQPRAGKSVEGIEFTCRENQPWGAGDVRHRVVTRPLLRFDFARPVNDMEYEVLDPRRGMLQAPQASVFNVIPDIRIHTLTGVVHVEVKSSSTSFEVERRSKTGGFAARGTEKTASARARMSEAQGRRKRAARAQGYGQRWFSGAQEEACRVIREIINGAEQQALLVDPYFGPNELTFALAVGQEGFPIQILSSAEVLKQVRQGSELGDTLLERIDRLGADDRLNPMKIRVMTGDRPEIHDRFLLVDGRIWLLGSSLNEFGSRGTMMVALSDPDSVRHQLLKAWNDAMDLRAWVEARRKHRKGALPEGT
jgi:hypothetical protein